MLAGVDVLMWGSKVLVGLVMYAQLLQGVAVVSRNCANVDPLQFRPSVQATTCARDTLLTQYDERSGFDYSLNAPLVNGHVPEFYAEYCTWQ